MTKIVNKFVLAGDKCMPKLHVRQARLTYSACVPFTKYQDRIKKFRETGNLKHIYKNELGKACFTYDIAYSDGKDLPKRTVSD